MFFKEGFKLNSFVIGTMSMYGRYLIYKEYNEKEVRNIIISYLTSSDNSNYATNNNVIEKIMKASTEKELVYDRYVIITKSEIEKIKKINHNIMERVVFILLVIQKFYSSNFVNVNRSQLQRLMKTKYDRKYFSYNIIHPLIKSGILHKHKRNVYKVNLNKNDNSDDEIVMTITDFDNCILQYLKTCNTNEFIYCSICGKKVKRTNNRQKYCKECAYEQYKINNKNCQKKIRKSKMSQFIN